MASITWPSTLPLPQQDGFSEEPPNSVVRFKPDIGPSLSRRRGTSGVRLFNLVYIFDSTAFSTWETFYLTTSFEGTLPFNFTNPRTSASVEAVITPGSVKYSSLFTQTRVSMTLEVLP